MVKYRDFRKRFLSVWNPSLLEASLERDTMQSWMAMSIPSALNILESNNFQTLSCE